MQVVRGEEEMRPAFGCILTPFIWIGSIALVVSGGLVVVALFEVALNGQLVQAALLTLVFLAMVTMFAALVQWVERLSRSQDAASLPDFREPHYVEPQPGSRVSRYARRNRHQKTQGYWQNE